MYTIANEVSKNIYNIIYNIYACKYVYPTECMCLNDVEYCLDLQLQSTFNYSYLFYRISKYLHVLQLELMWLHVFVYLHNPVLIYFV